MGFLCTHLPALLGIVFLAIGLTSTYGFDIRYNLASKTPYWPQQNYSTYTPPPSGCRAVHLNLVARHGSRHPGEYAPVYPRMSFLSN